MTFNIKKYQVIKNAVSYELANFIYNYFMLKRDAVKFMYDNNIIYDNGLLGTWTDEQVPNTYSHYADPVMETLMMKVLPIMQQETRLEWNEEELGPMPLRVILRNLEWSRSKCLWPSGDPKSIDFKFCGDAVLSGKPYCLKHCALAYNNKD